MNRDEYIKEAIQALRNRHAAEVAAKTYEWNPTPREFEEYRIRDVVHCVRNLLENPNLRLEDTLHTPQTFGLARSAIREAFARVVSSAGEAARGVIKIQLPAHIRGEALS